MIGRKQGRKIGISGQSLCPPSPQHILADTFFKIRDTVRCAVAHGLPEALTTGHLFPYWLWIHFGVGKSGIVFVNRAWQNT
jgi:hypothetical protein